MESKHGNTSVRCVDVEQLPANTLNNMPVLTCTCHAKSDCLQDV